MTVATVVVALCTSFLGGRVTTQSETTVVMPPPVLRYQPLGFGKIQVTGTYNQMREFLERYNESVNSEWLSDTDSVNRFEEVAKVARANGAILMSINSTSERKAFLDAIR